MTITIAAYKNRSGEWRITVTDVNDQVVTLEAGDLVRLKVGANSQTPILDLNNKESPTTNSFLSPRTNPCTLRLSQADTNKIRPGIHDLEVAVVDASDSNKIKHADKGIFLLFDTQGGQVANA